MPIAPAPEPNPYADGLGYTTPSNGVVIHPGLMPGYAWHFLAQEGLVFDPAQFVADQALGAVVLPMVNAGVKGLVTVTNALYGPYSIARPFAVNGNHDATPLCLVVCIDHKNPGTNQFRIGYTPIGGNMTADWWCGYEILGNK